MKSQISKLKSQNGMSLIEVIISMFMIAALLVFYTSALNLVALSKKTRKENIAYHIANKQMEDLRNTAFASLPASGTISDSMLSQIPSGSGGYTVSSYAGFSGMKEMVVTVSWNDGISRQVILKSLAGNGGLNP